MGKMEPRDDAGWIGDGQVDCDLLVVGGGINGAGIARDAAGRGLRVVLCDKDDLGSHTSSASSKLIHGGLRYLEQREFGLVRKALAEREILLKSAPHIMRPLRFVMPHRAGHAGQRSAWLIRAGLFLYDRLAPRAFLPASEAFDLAGHRAGLPLQPEFTRAFAYSDGWVDDARLVVLNAVDARERGALVLPRTCCESVARRADHWEARLRRGDTASAAPLQVRARALVNATGPWAARFARHAGGAANVPRHTLRLVKGSHIVVPRLFDHSCAYLFQHPDGRVVFALPYEGSFTLIGTTDVEFEGDPGAPAIGAGETEYLCALANRYFRRQITPRDVVWGYSGVRPLLEDAVARGARGRAADASRDYFLERDTEGPPLLSVFGGKITTYRKLAEEAVNWLAPLLGRASPAWTANAVLPGGDLFGPTPDARGVLQFDRWVTALRRRYEWLPAPLALRYARAYGTRVERVLEGCASLDDLGAEVAPGVYEAELRYLMEQEWAVSSADVLWRRTKLGLHLRPGVARDIDDWMARQLTASSSVAS